MLKEKGLREILAEVEKKSGRIDGINQPNHNSEAEIVKFWAETVKWSKTMKSYPPNKLKPEAVEDARKPYPKRSHEDQGLKMTDNIARQEQIADLQAKLARLNTHITQTELFLSANPNHQPTLNRHNILCHDKSETLTKIRRLEKRMK